MPNDVTTFVNAKGYDVSAAVTKYKMVKFTSDGTVGPVSSVADIPAGVALEGVTTGEIAKGKRCPVGMDGEYPFVAGATACAAGVALALGVLADGTLVPLGTGSAGTVVVGYCVHAAAANGRGSMRVA